MTKAGKRGAFAIVLLLVLGGFVYGQANTLDAALYEELAITPEDCLLVPGEKGGYYFLIRKKPRIASVLIASVLITAEVPNIVDRMYYTLEWNPVNGDEQYVLENPPADDPIWYPIIDSTAEGNETLGDAFRLYIPPALYRYDAGNGTNPWVRIPVREGMTVVIRSFAQSFIDPAGGFRDTRFILKVQSPDGESADSSEQAGDFDPGEPVEEAPVLAPAGLPATLRLWAGVASFNPGPDGNMGALELEKKTDLEYGITLTQGLTEHVNVSVGVERDWLLMNRFMARVAADWDSFAIEAGPAFGILNPTSDVTSPGLSLILKGKIIPDIVSGSVRLDSSLGRKPGIAGDYTQDLYELSLEGFTPWVTLTFSVSGRSVTRKNEQLKDIVGSAAKYNLCIAYDFQNTPLTLGLDIGYQQLTWIHYGAINPPRYSYKDIYLGPRAFWTIKPGTELFLTTEVPVSPTGYTSDPNAPMLVRAALGLNVKLR